MPTKLRLLKTRRIIPLDDCEWDLVLGPSAVNPIFPAADSPERRAAWEAYRGELMESYGRAGRRPHAFWWFEIDKSKIPADVCSEADCLWRLGLLSDEEKTIVEHSWEIDWAVSAMRTRGVDDLIAEALRRKIPKWWIIENKLTPDGEYLITP